MSTETEFGTPNGFIALKSNTQESLINGHIFESHGTHMASCDDPFSPVHTRSGLHDNHLTSRDSITSEGEAFEIQSIDFLHSTSESPMPIENGTEFPTITDTFDSFEDSFVNAKQTVPQKEASPEFDLSFFNDDLVQGALLSLPPLPGNETCPNDLFVDLTRARCLSTIKEGRNEDECSVTSSSSESNYARLDEISIRQQKHKVGTTKDPQQDESVVLEPVLFETTFGAPVRSLDEIVSPVLDGQHNVGVSPETLQNGLTTLTAESWQSISSEDDITAVARMQTSLENSPVEPQIKDIEKGNTPGNQPADNLLSPPPIRGKSPTDDEDVDSDYIRLDQLNLKPSPLLLMNNSSGVSTDVSGQMLPEAMEASESIPPSTTRVTLSDLNSVTTQEEVAQHVEENYHVNLVVEETASHSGADGTQSSHETSFQGEAQPVISMEEHHQQSQDEGIENISAEAILEAAVPIYSVDIQHFANSAAQTSTIASPEHIVPEVNILPSTDSVNEHLHACSGVTDQGGEVTMPQQGGNTQDSNMVEGYSNLDSSVWESGTNDVVSNSGTPTQETNLDISSNLDTGMRTLSPNSSPARSSQTGLPILAPLSPEHGNELTEQYEFLRRTLSHSRRRYSQRRQHPRQRRNDEETPDIQTSGNGTSGGRRHTHAVGSGDQTSTARETVGHLRDILRSSDEPAAVQRIYETHVDQHGRTYYMDHSTKTIAFNRRPSREGVGQSFRGPTSELQTRREMLDRRYQSLQRSFRRSSNDRPNIQRRRTSRPDLDNQSLTLTVAEAEAMARGQFSSSRNKKKKSGSKTGRWLFGRRSSKNSTVTQQGANTGDDELPVFSPPPTSRSSEFVVQSASSHESSRSRSRTASIESSSGGSRVSDSESNTQIAASAAIVIAESVLEERQVGTRSRSELESTAQTVTEQNQRSERESGDSLTESGEHALSPAISTVGRQGSIVRASGLTVSDRDAAVRARRRASHSKSDVTRNSIRRDTDELTNEGESLRHSTVLQPQQQTEGVRSGSEDREHQEATERDVDTNVRVKERKLKASLLECPALKFITRKDLYTFLKSSGSSGEQFFANRALMELVQRIRADNYLFEKYQHSKHLVSTLNHFADVNADLPEHWEKKLNRQGKVFFIDHKDEITTFIDPRLPLPDQQFTYTAPLKPVPSKRVSASLDDNALRPHHTTTVRNSISLEVDTLSPPPTPTTLTPTTPTSTSSTSSVVELLPAAEATVTPPTYEEQVVTFFRQPDVHVQISQRYHRGVRPQLQDMIQGIRMEGTTVLERIQMAGTIATYELALVLSLFEEEIGQMQPGVTPSVFTGGVQQTPPYVVVNPPPAQNTPTPTASPAVNPTPPQSTTQSQTPSDQSIVSSITGDKSTLQRRKEAFPVKLQNFKMMMARLGFAQSSRLKYNIRRDHMLEDAYEHVMKSDLKQLQNKRLNITFRGEEGLDYGGPSREFFFLLSREIFNPYYGLFEYSANDTYTVQISQTSCFIQNNLEWFRFAGRIVGLAIAQGFLLDVFFTRTIYKSLLCRAPVLKDLEALEPAFHNSLLWILENDPEPLDLTFTVEEEAFGQLSTHEFKANGDEIPVTDDNKEEYIDLMIRWRLDRGVAEQMRSFKRGFNEVMPVNLLHGFDAQELEFLTAGTLEIDVDDWRAHTEYRNGYHPSHPVVLWFWKAVEMFDNEQRLRLLQFVTGTSSVPFEGFKALRGSNGPKRFCIDFFNDTNAFPRTHTCFNRIDLPPYPSFEALYEKLRFAVEEGGGFGIE